MITSPALCTAARLRSVLVVMPPTSPCEGGCCLARLISRASSLLICFAAWQPERSFPFCCHTCRGRSARRRRRRWLPRIGLAHGTQLGLGRRVSLRSLRSLFRRRRRRRELEVVVHLAVRQLLEPQRVCLSLVVQQLPAPTMHSKVSGGESTWPKRSAIKNRNRTGQSRISESITAKTASSKRYLSPRQKR